MNEIITNENSLNALERIKNVLKDLPTSKIVAGGGIIVILGAIKQGFNFKCGLFELQVNVK